MHVLIFYELVLKIPIHAPKMKVSGGGLTHDLIATPQKAHPRAETRRITYRLSNRSVSAGWTRFQ